MSMSWEILFVGGMIAYGMRTGDWKRVQHYIFATAVLVPLAQIIYLAVNA